MRGRVTLEDSGESGMPAYLELMDVIESQLET